MLWTLLHGTFGKRIFVPALAAFVLTSLACQALADQLWPEGLREAVNSYFQTLQVTEYGIRDSTLSDPAGIQPMTSFDRASHKCHEVPGQVYRVFRVPGYYSGEKGVYMVRSRFDLFFRQAEDIAGIFSQPWGQGSGGALQVWFELVDGKWEVVEKREVLE